LSYANKPIEKVSTRRASKRIYAQPQSTRSNVSHGQSNNDHERLTLRDLNTILVGFVCGGVTKSSWKLYSLVGRCAFIRKLPWCSRWVNILFVRLLKVIRCADPYDWASRMVVGRNVTCA